ncbi:MAG: OmpA family protein [Bacteroidales bacterium]|nr:OmpA family protein [Bacteroidales bacterium]
MATEETTTNSNRKSSSKFWVWILAGALILLTSAYIIDKITSNKKYKNLETKQQQTSEELKKIKTETASKEEAYYDLEKKYNALNSQVGGLKDSSNTKQAEIEKMRIQLAQQDSVVKVINKLVTGAMNGFKNDELKVQVRDGKVYVTMLDKLLFKSGSADVEKKGLDAIKKLSKVLLNNPDIGIMVEGHTDNLPIKTSQYKDNWDLSAARATNIVRLLSNEGLPQKRLTASGRGEFSPVASNNTEAGRAMNRRTEIILTPNLDEIYKLTSK